MVAMQRIVVGIDGSEASRAALRWALDEARLRGASLEAVQAWHSPGVEVTGYGGTALPVFTFEDLEKATELNAHATVAEIIDEEREIGRAHV